MRGMAEWLITEDKPEKADVCFVLGGGSYDRGKKAAELYKEGYADLFVCTSENVPSILEAMGDTLTEAEVTAFFMQKSGIPEEKIIVINKATSTREESVVLSEFCNERNFNKALVISSRFHLRRVRRVFSRAFENSQTKLIYNGAPAGSYNELEWWRTEEGLIALNNEYMKLVWYWFTE